MANRIRRRSRAGAFRPPSAPAAGEPITRYVCPRCGQSHPAAGCGVLAVSQLEPDRRVSVDDLRRLAGQLEHVVATAVLADELDEARRFARTLAGVNSRISRDS